MLYSAIFVKNLPIFSFFGPQSQRQHSTGQPGNFILYLKGLHKEQDDDARMFDHILEIIKSFGEWGMAFLAFSDAFFSPIVPDILLIPMCLAAPERAIFLTGLATLASVLGACIGYGIGHRFGPFAQAKLIPPKHMRTIQELMDKHGGWAVFWGAMAPIPYKFVAISSGILNINFRLFLLATILGRAKRFLLMGIAVYYVGPHAIKLMEKYTLPGAIALAVLLGLAGYWYIRRQRRKEAQADCLLP